MPNGNCWEDLEDCEKSLRKKDEHIKALEKKIVVLEAELAGKRAKQRSLMMASIRSGPPGYILCPCGLLLKFMEEIPAHLDHMIDAHPPEEEDSEEKK